MAGNGTDLVFPAGNINNSARPAEDISASGDAICENPPEIADNWQHISVPAGRVVARALSKIRQRLVER